MVDWGEMVARWAKEKRISAVVSEHYHREVIEEDFARVYDFESSPCIDFGKFLCRVPSAVLRPDSEEELRQILAFLSETGIRFAARGHGHSSGGQALIDEGVVIDLSGLSGLGACGESGLLQVAAGTPWINVIRSLARQKRRPRVTTSNWWTTVGGTLSVGGFGERSHHLGMQADHVEALRVATLDGDLRSVSFGQELFDYSLAGGGALGVITAATISTEPGTWLLNAKQLHWSNLSKFLSSHSELSSPESYPFLRSRVQWEDDSLAVRGVGGAFVGEGASDVIWGFNNSAERGVAETIDLYEHLSLKPTKRWRSYCPALEFFLPLHQAETTLLQIRDELNRAGLIKFIPEGSAIKPLVFNSRLPLAPYPSAKHGVMVALRPELPHAMVRPSLDALHRISQRITAAGGTFYLISIPLHLPGWFENQYADQLFRWIQLANRYDQKRLIESGPRARLIDREKTL